MGGSINSSLSASPDDILIFVDDTGHESLQQPGYPVFGYGGIAIFGRDYESLLAEPWRQLKTSFGVDLKTPLHRDFQFGKKEIDAFNNFFQAQGFHRFFTAFTGKTDITSTTPEEVAPLSLVPRLQDAVMRMLNLRFDNYFRTGQKFGIGKVAVVFESSERGNALIQKAIPDMEKHFILNLPQAMVQQGSIHFPEPSRVQVINQVVQYRLPAKGYFMAKINCEPGLEVAHWVANTAGRQANHQIRPEPKTQQQLKDYCEVFTKNAQLCSGGVFIEKVSVSRKSGQ